MTDFLGDENFSKDIAKILDIFDKYNSISWMPDYLADMGYPNHGRGVADEEWMRFLSIHKPNSVVIGSDDRITRNPVQRKVLKESNLMYLVLGNQWGNYKRVDQICKLLKSWDNILKELRNINEPTLLAIKFKKNSTKPEIVNYGLTKDFSFR